LSQGEESTIDYETDGFSLMLNKEQIKNKREIIGYLKKSIDHLKHKTFFQVIYESTILPPNKKPHECGA
jgi:hypothetical protein